MNVFDIEPREWNRIYFPMLDYKSLLNLLVISKQLNKQKSIIYRLIYIKIFNETIPEESSHFCITCQGDKEININLYKTNIDEIKNLTRLFLRNNELSTMLVKHTMSGHKEFKIYRDLFITYFHTEPRIDYNIDSFVKNYCKSLTTLK